MVQPGSLLPHKFYFRGNWRRLRISTAFTFQQLLQTIKDLLPELQNANFSLKYKDDEDCLITVTSDPEYEEAKRLGRSLITLKFFIVEKHTDLQPTEINPSKNEGSRGQENNLLPEFEKLQQPPMETQSEHILLLLENLCSQNAQMELIAEHCELAKALSLILIAVEKVRTESIDDGSIFFDRAACLLVQTLEEDASPEVANLSLRLVEEFINLTNMLHGHREWCSPRVLTVVETKKKNLLEGYEEVREFTSEVKQVDSEVNNSDTNDSMNIQALSAMVAEGAEAKRKKNIEECFIRIREMGLLNDENFVAVWRANNFEPIETFDKFFAT